ncbi:MAG TPA: hypothetical protein V6C86_22005 [Oculatellaceae cyanobacterium]
MNCPHCHHELSESEVKQLLAEYSKSHVPAPKAITSAANGRKGGRPVTYLQNVYDLIPGAIKLHHDTRTARKERFNFDIELVEEADPIANGFTLRCGGITRKCRWNRITNFVEIFDSAQQVGGFNTINNSAQTAAKRLVEEIHIAKLMSMPEDFSDIENWAKANIRGMQAT